MKEYCVVDTNQPFNKIGNVVLLSNKKVKDAKAPAFAYLTSYFLNVTADKPFESNRVPQNLGPGEENRQLVCKYNADNEIPRDKYGYFMLFHDAGETYRVLDMLIIDAFEKAKFKVEVINKDIQEAINLLADLIFIEHRLWGKPTYCHTYRLSKEDLSNWLNMVLLPMFEEMADDINATNLELFKKALAEVTSKYC